MDSKQTDVWSEHHHENGLLLNVIPMAAVPERSAVFGIEVAYKSCNIQLFPTHKYFLHPVLLFKKRENRSPNLKTIPISKPSPMMHATVALLTFLAVAVAASDPCGPATSDPADPALELVWIGQRTIYYEYDMGGDSSYRWVGRDDQLPQL